MHRSLTSDGTLRLWPLVAVLAAGCATALTLADGRSGGQSEAAIRFFGTGTNQQDRVRIAIDDNAPGPDASAVCDLGAGSFTIEF